MDDYGYGDPGYADPSYEGPRGPHHGPAFGGPASGGQHGGPGHAAAPRRSGGSGYRSSEVGLPGYHVPEIRDSARPGPAGPGYQPQGFAPPSGGQRIWPVTGAQQALPDTYPDQWYDHPRLDDRVLDDVRHDQPRPGGPRLGAPPAARARVIRGSRA